MKTLTLLLLLLSVSTHIFAGLKLRVVDSDGQSVANAVVSVSGIEASVLRNKQRKAEAETAIMDQIDKQFSPHVLIVESGQYVVFPNSDQVRHHVYSFSKPNDFEIRLYSGDQADPVKFSSPGIVVMGCNIHDQMQAFLYVTGNQELAQVSDEQGLVELDLNAFNHEPKEVSVWHSRLSSERTLKVVQKLTEKDSEGNWLLRVDLLPEPKKNNRKFKFRYD